MNHPDYHHLLFRRQYLISPIQIECPFRYDTIKINGNYTLYYHRDLVVTKVSNKKRTLILLGDLYDFQDQKASNTEIINKLLVYDFLTLVEETFRFAGRFVLIYAEPNVVKLYSDAVAQRKIFHTIKDNNVHCASNPHLLAKVLGLEKTKNNCWLDYYQSSEFKENLNSNIGYFTLYDEIRQVLPNHYLDLVHNNVYRFWPLERIKKIEDKDVVHHSAQMIKGFVLAAANRYPLMIPVTAGGDSRLILAATKERTRNVFYYINFSKDIENKPDIWVPKKLLKKINRKFNILYPDERIVDNEFKQAYYTNNPIPHDYFLAIIYNYYLHYPEKVNVPGGVIPIIKSLYHTNEKEITGKKLAHLYKVEKYPCSIDFYNDWLNGFNNECKNSDISLFDLLYWEDRTCNWAGQIIQDKDIAQEEFIPFNSQQLIITMLNYTKSRRTKPRFELHNEIIKELWPELLEIPFNPSLKNTIKSILIYLGIYRLFYNIWKFIHKLIK